MGVEKLMTSLRRHMITRDSFTAFEKKKFSYKNVKHLLLDFNSIIHNKSAEVMYRVNQDFEKELIQKKIYDEKEVFTLYKKKYENLNELIIENIVKEINFLVDHCGDSLQLLYIGIDGVPSKAKIVEQKERRYSSSVVNLLNNNILVEKHRKRLSEQKTDQGYPNSYIHTKYKINWNKTNISPRSMFMNDLAKVLDDKNKFIKNKKTCQRITYKFSNYTEPGEAEKKITELMLTDKSIKVDDKIIFISPDGDVILLSMLLPHKKVHVLRDISSEEHHKGDYELIDIHHLRHKLLSYMQSILIRQYKVKKIENLKTRDIIRDIIFIFSFFGDDFTHKVESYRVGYHLYEILKSYIKACLRNNGVSLTNSNKTINQKVFMSLLKNLCFKRVKSDNTFGSLSKKSKKSNKKKVVLNVENIILIESYLSDYYSSYQYVRGKFVEWLSTYKKAPPFGYYVILLKRGIMVHDTICKFLMQRMEVTEEKVCHYIKKKYNVNLRKKLHFIINFLINTLWQNFSDDQEYRVYSIDHYRKEFKKNRNRCPSLNLSIKKNDLGTYMKKKIRNLERDGKLPKRGSFSDLPLYLQEQSKDNNYYSDKLKIDQMFGKYRKQVQINDDIKLGRVDTPSKENNYSYNFYRYHQKMKKYYYSNYFENKDCVIKDYLTVLMWIFYYYNNDTVETSRWHYPYRRVPLLQDVYLFLKRNPGFDINKYTREIYDKNLVKKNDPSYFSPSDQLFFITPWNEIKDIIGPPYSEFIDNVNLLNKDYKRGSRRLERLGFTDKEVKKINKIFTKKNFPSTHKIAKDFYVNNKSNINCDGSLYFNKCEIEDLNDIKIDDQDFIKIIRKIK